LKNKYRPLAVQTRVRPRMNPCRHIIDESSSCFGQD
jgi:hypothetical protein